MLVISWILHGFPFCNLHYCFFLSPVGMCISSVFLNSSYMYAFHFLLFVIGLYCVSCFHIVINLCLFSDCFGYFKNNCHHILSMISAFLLVYTEVFAVHVCFSNEYLKYCAIFTIFLFCLCFYYTVM